MTELCSVCLLESAKKLTPLFTKNNNHWHSTGLSEMLETVLEEKILKARLKGQESMMTICTTCIYKISKLFHEDPLELTLKTFKEKYCTPVDQKEPHQIKKLKTNNELETIKFEVYERRDHINCIPLECMAEIFTYLCPYEMLQVEKVCKQWKNASEIAWGKIKKLDLQKDIVCYKGFSYSDSMFLSEKTSKQVLSRSGRYLEKLKIKCGFFGSNFLSFVNNYCQNLKEIQIEAFVNNNLPSFDEAFSKMKLLTTIHMFIHDSEEEIPMDFARLISTLPSEIENIDIEYYNNVYQCYWKIDGWALNRFNALKSLSLSGFELGKKAMTGLLKKDTLVELKLENCLHASNARLLTKKIPSLDKLGYYYIASHPSDLFFSFVNYCENLKMLNLKLEHLMSKVMFNELKKLKQLQYVHLSFLPSIEDNNAIGILADSCPNLRGLELKSWSCDPVEFGFENISNFVNLKYLTLRDMKGMNDDHLSSIAINCKKLKYLNLFECTGISNSGLEKLGNFVNLEYLSIPEIKHADDGVILSITSNCMKLKELNLRNLENISDSAFETLVQLKELRILDICRAKKINENVISIIFANCKKLRKFNYSVIG